jgi:hypothetical protein
MSHTQVGSMFANFFMTQGCRCLNHRRGHPRPCARNALSTQGGTGSAESHVAEGRNCTKSAKTSALTQRGADAGTAGGSRQGWDR